jgi:hypothetical protein
MTSNKEIRNMLNFDSLQEAEKITNKSYKTDKVTETFGFGLHLAQSKMKEKMLNKMGDTTLRNEVTKYLEIVQGIGFEVVLKDPCLNAEGITEHLYILWHDEYSILLRFDTHTWADDGSWAKSGKEVPPPSVNGGSFYYNIKLNDDCDWKVTSSGGFRDGVWVGHHDCREAIKFKISQLAANGTFQKKWVERPFLWLVAYTETKDKYDYDEINAERIARLPQHVIDAISPENN